MQSSKKYSTLKVPVQFAVLLPCLLFPWTEASAKPKPDSLIVSRTTYIGPGEGPFQGSEKFLTETGNLFCKQGFIPSSSAEIYLAGDSVTEFMPVSGKFYVGLSYYTTYDNQFDMSCFPRSAETYSLSNTPAVAINYGSSGTNGGSPKPVASIAATQPSASESGAVAGDFLIALNSATAKTITVKYSISGTAKKRKDFKKLSGKVKILAGNVSAVVTVIPVTDQAVEGPETVTLTIKPSKKYGIGASEATITIADGN